MACYFGSYLCDLNIFVSNREAGKWIRFEHCISFWSFYSDKVLWETFRYNWQNMSQRIFKKTWSSNQRHVHYHSEMVFFPYSWVYAFYIIRMKVCMCVGGRIFVLLENFSLSWRHHVERLQILTYARNLWSYIEQRRFLSVPHLMGHGTSVYHYALTDCATPAASCEDRFVLKRNGITFGKHLGLFHLNLICIFLV